MRKGLVIFKCTVSIKMLTLVTVLGCLVLLFQASDAASVKHHQNYPRKESTATFLRLTALRSDEGVWSARFGDYEISIELRHHPRLPYDNDYNDTWTLKVKHTPKHFVMPYENGDIATNEVMSDYNHESPLVTPAKSESWKETLDNFDDEDDAPVVKKTSHTSRKTKRKGNAKARRQLSTSTVPTLTEKSFVEDRIDVSDPIQLPIMTELTQGNTRINVAFDANDSDSNVADQTAELERKEELPWENIAAVIYDGISKSSDVTPVGPIQGTNDRVTYNPDDEVLTDAYALPIHQSLTSDKSEYSQVHPLTIESGNPSNPEIWDFADEHRVNMPVVEATKISGKDNVTEVEGQKHLFDDYAVEDPRVHQPDVDEYDDRNKSDVSSEADDVTQDEVTPEVKRIMNWFKRSKPLTTENNGYKFFPGVGWFKFVPWAERWATARKVCESEGAHLAIPDSKEKTEIFLQIFKNYPDVLESSILRYQVFVGLIRSGLLEDFITVRGKPFKPNSSLWFPGEPDNAAPGEDCVTFHMEGKIRDVPCFYNLPFLCEKEPDIS